MKAHGKGLGISLNTSQVNKWKQLLATASDGLPRSEFKPLKVKPHPRQAEIDLYKSLPSRFA